MEELISKDKLCEIAILALKGTLESEVLTAKLPLVEKRKGMESILYSVYGKFLLSELLKNLEFKKNPEKFEQFLTHVQQFGGGLFWQILTKEGKNNPNRKSKKRRFLVDFMIVLPQIGVLVEFKGPTKDYAYVLRGVSGNKINFSEAANDNKYDSLEEITKELYSVYEKTYLDKKNSKEDNTETEGDDNLKNRASDANSEKLENKAYIYNDSIWYDVFKLASLIEIAKPQREICGLCFAILWKKPMKIEDVEKTLSEMTKVLNNNSRKLGGISFNLRKIEGNEKLIAFAIQLNHSI